MRLVRENGRVLPRLTFALQLSQSHEQDVREALERRLYTNTDRHTIFREIGEDLDFLSEEVTARAFASTWSNFSEEAIRAIWDPVLPHLALLSDSTH